MAIWISTKVNKDHEGVVLPVALVLAWIRNSNSPVSRLKMFLKAQSLISFTECRHTGIRKRTTSCRKYCNGVLFGNQFVSVFGLFYQIAL
ncbi:hypothetical protein R1flu_027425 [Riccia fluitans]|uniref:Uncharacterized protein n=1 Tax=Riccia fluitans TaxID=41844 RepID=A0ABD1XIT8_9MARC